MEVNHDLLTAVYLTLGVGQGDVFVSERNHKFPSSLFSKLVHVSELVLNQLSGEGPRAGCYSLSKRHPTQTLISVLRMTAGEVDR